jgi:hypothetical protein
MFPESETVQSASERSALKRRKRRAPLAKFPRVHPYLIRSEFKTVKLDRLKINPTNDQHEPKVST